MRADRPACRASTGRINAALLLAYVRLKLGDRVGLVRLRRAAASGQRLRRGTDALSRMLQALAAERRLFHRGDQLHPGLSTPWPSGLNRRSMVVVFTDFADTISAELMVENVGAADAAPPRWCS